MRRALVSALEDPVGDVVHDFFLARVVVQLVEPAGVLRRSARGSGVRADGDEGLVVGLEPINELLAGLERDDAVVVAEVDWRVSVVR